MSSRSTEMIPLEDMKHSGRYVSLVRTENKGSWSLNKIIYLNVNITTNAQFDDLGLCDPRVYAEFDLLLLMLKPS